MLLSDIKAPWPARCAGVSWTGGSGRQWSKENRLTRAKPGIVS